MITQQIQNQLFPGHQRFPRNIYLRRKQIYIETQSVEEAIRQTPYGEKSKVCNKSPPRFITVPPPIFNLLISNTPECMICAEKFKENNVLLAPCCGKIFHTECINKWTYKVKKTRFGEEHCVACNQTKNFKSESEKH